MATTLRHGTQNNFLIQQGDVLVVDTSMNAGAASVWFIKSGRQDVLAANMSNGQRRQFGPYMEQTSVRVEATGGVVTVSTDPISDPSGSPVSATFGTLVKPVAGSTYLLSGDDHGYVLLFAAACTVTIPKGLRSDFSCGWSQESAGAVTFAGASGVTVNSKGGVLASSAQYSVGGLSAFAQDVFRLMGV